MQKALPAMTEAAFSDQVHELAKMFGWRTAHFRPAQTSRGWRTAVQGDGVGFPDWVLVRPPRLVFAELKREVGLKTPEQRDWLEALRKCSPAVEVYLWRPSQLEEIAKILR